MPGLRGKGKDAGVAPPEEALRRAVLMVVARAKAAVEAECAAAEKRGPTVSVATVRERAITVQLDPTRLCKAIKASNPQWAVHKGKVHRMLKRIQAELEAAGAESCSDAEDAFEELDADEASDMPLAPCENKTDKAARHAQVRRQAKERKRALDMALASVGVVVEGPAREASDWIVVSHAVDCSA